MQALLRQVQLRRWIKVQATGQLPLHPYIHSQCRRDSDPSAIAKILRIGFAVISRTSRSPILKRDRLNGGFFLCSLESIC
jgi:hypothetical protein